MKKASLGEKPVRFLRYERLPSKLTEGVVPEHDTFRISKELTEAEFEEDVEESKRVQGMRNFIVDRMLDYTVLAMKMLRAKAK